MIHDSFDSIFGISDGKPNDNRTDWIDIVMDNTCGRDGVLCELVS